MDGIQVENEASTSNDKTILLAIITNLFNILKEDQNSNDNTNVAKFITNLNLKLEESEQDVWGRFLDLDVWNAKVEGMPDSRGRLTKKLVLGLLFDVKQHLQIIRVTENLENIAQTINTRIKELSIENQIIWRLFLKFNYFILSRFRPARPDQNQSTKSPQLQLPTVSTLSPYWNFYDTVERSGSSLMNETPEDDDSDNNGLLTNVFGARVTFARRESQNDNND